MKLFFLYVLTISISVVVSCCDAYAQADSALWELSNVLSAKASFEQDKNARIEQLKRAFHQEPTALRKRQTALRLADEYKKYQIDSAIKYISVVKSLGEQEKNAFATNQASIYLAGLYSSAGKFIECEQLLRSVRRNELAEELLPAYFESYTAFNSHYGQSSDNELYFRRSEVYRDSLLSVLDTGSLDFQVAIATRYLFRNDAEQAEHILQTLLKSTTDEQPERGLIAYLIGVIYKNRGDVDRQLYYFALSAISDTKNVVKDNASLQSLAQCFYKMGDIDRAFLFIQEAINDSEFCNVRYRSLENSSFYSIINAAFQDKEQAKKRMLWHNLAVISFLTFLLIVALFILYIQLKKLRAARASLHDANQELKELNAQLLDVNRDLSESNHIKEAYIAQFFDLCSNYIDKIDEQRKVLLKKFTAKQYDEISRLLKSQDLLKNELEELYHNFDIIFLNLYPSFIDDFNNLLRPDERIILKTGELLNTELRIFALIRLGITDSAKIASFLRYSLRTVYNYRVKVRAKVAGSKDEFEERIRNIGDFRSM